MPFEKRVLVAPNESLSNALKVPPALVGQVIQIRADDGGTIQRDGGAARPLARDTLRLTHTIGPDAGRYILKFMAPGFSQVMEFWTGPLRGLPVPHNSRSPALYLPAFRMN